MNFRIAAITGFLTLMALSAFTGANAEPRSPALAPAEQIDACVARVTDSIDSDDATRIRHEVASVKRRAIGYRLLVNTVLYGETDGAPIRTYASECIVTKAKEPIAFRIEEKQPES